MSEEKRSSMVEDGDDGMLPLAPEDPDARRRAFWEKARRLVEFLGQCVELYSKIRNALGRF
jgi:hypothetical protein